MLHKLVESRGGKDNGSVENGDGRPGCDSPQSISPLQRSLPSLFYMSVQRRSRSTRSNDGGRRMILGTGDACLTGFRSFPSELPYEPHRARGKFESFARPWYDLRCEQRCRTLVLPSLGAPQYARQIPPPPHPPIPRTRPYTNTHP